MSDTVLALREQAKIVDIMACHYKDRSKDIKFTQNQLIRNDEIARIAFEAVRSLLRLADHVEKRDAK